MNQYAGILTAVDNEEHDASDAQWIIGMTHLLPDESAVQTAAEDLALQFMMEEHPFDYQMRLESGAYSIHLDVLSPGKCNAQGFLVAKWAHMEDGKIKFR